MLPHEARFVCAILPYGEPQETISQSSDTNSIIGFDQYRRLKAVLTSHDVQLYNPLERYRDSDVLVIMSTIWTVPTVIFEKFKKVIYFYDDVEVWKAKTEKYQASLRFVDIVLHPEPDVVSQLSGFWDKPTFYMPWASSWLPERANSDGAQCKVFIDLDTRQFAAKSVEYAVSFVTTLQDSPAQFFVPASTLSVLPGNVRARVESVPKMRHGEFLQFLSGMTWYASGISSSYEYIVMESALLGCGLVSLYNAVRRFHRNRTCVVDFRGDADVWDQIKAYDVPQTTLAVVESAKKLYPFEAVAEIPSIVETVFRS